MEEINHQLTDVSIRQQQLVEQLSGRQKCIELALEQLRLGTAGRIPLPEPRVQAQQLLTKLKEHDDIEAYLRAYYSFQAPSYELYADLKQKILVRVGLSPVCAAQRFHEWVYDLQLPAGVQAAQLSQLAQLWLLSGNPVAGQVAEMLDRSPGR